MLQQQQKPLPQDLASLQEWMKRTSMGGCYLQGQDSDVWKDPDHSDLISLKPPGEHDMLSSLVTTNLAKYHRLIGRFFKVRDLCPSQAELPQKTYF